MPRRPDGELVKTSKFRELEFYIMKNRNESAIYFETEVDLTNTNAFLKEYNKNREEEEKLTLFQIILAAGVRTIALRPKMNRFVSGRRLWQRNEIKFNFVAKKEKTEEGEEVNVMIEFDPFDDLEKVRKKVAEHIHEARYGVNPNEKDVKFFGSLPRFVIRFIFWLNRWLDEHNCPIHSITKDMPLWSSVFFAHLGSIGIEAVYHHLFDLGTNGIFITIGEKRTVAKINPETEKVEKKEVMDLKISIDDRIASGAYTGPSVHLLRDLIENPEPLKQSPDLSDEQLDKLMLKKYKKERLEREKERKRIKRKKRKQK
ncbi:MAG: hypothetical protein GF308_13710 [Candidatus Heimdallarchaeota archaeon]|nr:hypothetical protein [Candidatus Heimdallarchaeota archaeon]